MAALPAFSRISYNYIDGILVAWLVVGIFRGRKRGMTQELLPSTQWVLITLLAGLFYGAFGRLIYQGTSGAFNHLWSDLTAYLIIAFAIHVVFLWLKDVAGEKLTGSDLFGKSEYYLGMMAGLIRFACMFLVLIAVVHARIYTASELAETEKEQKRNFEGIRFPTFGSIQHAMLFESLSGQWVCDHLGRILISSEAPPKATETIGKKREDTINAIIGPAKK
jgi:hypothetical protein